ncbi:hypothetical protein PC120_g16313 [Phytophthora cactorum]|nr:hypothetical protein PC120_g16313 [Phytophthora cactorum]
MTPSASMCALMHAAQNALRYFVHAIRSTTSPQHMGHWAVGAGCACSWGSGWPASCSAGCPAPCTARDV